MYRGPQGKHFGKNAEAGVIKTQKTILTYFAFVSASAVIFLILFVPGFRFM